MKQIAKIIASIENWWNMQTNQRHWYEIKLSYWENGVQKFDWVSQIGVLKKKTMLDSREVKKSLLPLHKINFTSKPKLKNGVLTVTTICYLGKFSQKSK
jgi:RIO-like serine/threonine protein kinase